MAKKENLVKIQFMNCDFFVNQEKPGKLEKDLETVKTIFDKGIENLDTVDRVNLLTVYKAAYHESGKIEGVTSYDSTATNCAFCKAIRAANETNDLCICNGCYDMAQEAYRINVLNRHTLNMLIMMTVEFTVDELRMLPATAIDRVNSSGDTPNEIYARNMLKLCYAFPHAHFAYWAKNTVPSSQRARHSENRQILSWYSRHVKSVFRRKRRHSLIMFSLSTQIRKHAKWPSRREPAHAMVKSAGIVVTNVILARMKAITLRKCYAAPAKKKSRHSGKCW